MPKNLKTDVIGAGEKRDGAEVPVLIDRKCAREVSDGQDDVAFLDRFFRAFFQYDTCHSRQGDGRSRLIIARRQRVSWSAYVLGENRRFAQGNTVNVLLVDNDDCGQGC